jgi:ferredoxin
MKVTIHTERCMASGACVQACPEVFAQDENGIVVLLDPEPGSELAEAVEDAIDACPAEVIEAS